MGFAPSACLLEMALYHSLGKLPEPEVTHEFSLILLTNLEK
jgi:hypothetical protein